MIMTEWKWYFIPLVLVGFFIVLWSNISNCYIYLEQLNKTKYKKRKKGASFKEWIFFSRFKKQLPPSLFYINAFGLISAPIMVFAFAILALLQSYIPAWQIMSYTYWIWFFANYAWIILLWLLNRRLTDRRTDFRRWIKRSGKKWHDD